MTEDPVKDGVNWYVYCYNNPLAWLDPDGKEPTPAPERELTSIYDFKPPYWEMSVIRTTAEKRNSFWGILGSFSFGVFKPGVMLGMRAVQEPGKLLDDATLLFRDPGKWSRQTIDNIHNLAHIAKYGDNATRAEIAGMITGIVGMSYLMGSAAGSATGTIVGGATTFMTNAVGDTLILSTATVISQPLIAGISTTANIVSTINTTSVLMGGQNDGNQITNASDLPTIKKGTKEWDAAVKQIREGGKTNFKTETASDAKDLLKEARGNMDVRKRYTSAKYKKGYEMHPSEATTKNAPHNDLQHIKWKDWIDENGAGAGHIFFEK